MVAEYTRHFILGQRAEGPVPLNLGQEEQGEEKEKGGNRKTSAIDSEMRYQNPISIYGVKERITSKNCVFHNSEGRRRFGCGGRGEGSDQRELLTPDIHYLTYSERLPVTEQKWGKKKKRGWRTHCRENTEATMIWGPL